MEDANGYLKQLYENKIKQLETNLGSTKEELSKVSRELLDEKKNIQVLREEKINLNQKIS